MKKTLWIIGGLLLGVWAVSEQNQPKQEPDELLLRNIEALAGNEGGTFYMCRGTGEVECPSTGVKVNYYNDWFSLRP